MICRFTLAAAALLLGLVNFSHAQSFEPGLLVRSTGDTLRGEIENASWSTPPPLINFRPAPGSAIQPFQPRQLRFVRLGSGRVFRYAALPLDEAAETRLDRLPQGNASNIRIDSVLADVLLDGPASLLRVVTLGTTHYCIVASGRPTLDLCERSYLAESSNGTAVVKNGNNYQGQLAVYFAACAEAARAAETAAFKPRALIAVVQAYNRSCSAARQAGQDQLTTAAPQHRLALRGGLVAGFRYNHINSFDGPYGDRCLDCRPRPLAGLFGELLLPGRTTALYGELTASRVEGRYIVYHESVVAAGSKPVEYYSFADYRATLLSARLGLRRYVALSPTSKLLLGLSYEWNLLPGPDFYNLTTGGSTGTTSGPPPANFQPNKVRFAQQTLLPALTIGWQLPRLTLAVDGQFCHSTDGPSLSLGNELYLSASWMARLTAAYRLGRNPDAMRTVAAPQ